MSSVIWVVETLGTFSTLVIKLAASKRNNRPLNGSPIPVRTFITSFACKLPTIPGSTPKTPPSAQLGTIPGGGGLGNKSR